MDLAAAAVISMLVMTGIVAVRYLAVSGAFAWLTARRVPGLYDGQERQMRREIAWSLASAAIFGLPAGLVAWGWQERGWTQIYSDWSTYPLWWMPVSIALYLFLHDTWFYWTHRWMHWPKVFKAADGMGGDELPSARGGDRSGRDPGARFHHPHSCGRAADRADDHDGDGGDQSHGMGIVSQPVG